MLITVVVLYAVIWLPMNIFQLHLNLVRYSKVQCQILYSYSILPKIIHIASCFLTISNTVINPTIYDSANIRFRSDLRQIRHSIFQCHERTSSYYRTRFARIFSHELQSQLRDSKMN
ncbi:unnamed protein product [Rotaria sp. Silwood2]|nr:unnamed protein product [Rotaria sp. Silwood2]CAF2716894.1 unnamed protein product [Rotaria sp. Silwood2]CAF2868614.1 unnamed protein product [Rotaria sp. Silwood2]CAF4159582.1 unnamed protein product [Rotaria sp. Silwood2]CAF4236137.1 unnamed protein product [Rotaria sp. Silwood2]